MTARVTATLRRARARLYLAALVRVGGWAGAAFAVFCAAVGVAARNAAHFPALPTVLVAFGAAGAATLWAASRLTPDLTGTVRALDRHFELAERLSTSLEVTHRHDALASALRADAAARIAALDLRGFVRPRLRLAQAAALTVAVALVGWAWLGPAIGGAGPLAAERADAAAPSAPRALLTHLPASVERAALPSSTQPGAPRRGAREGAEQGAPPPGDGAARTTATPPAAAVAPALPTTTTTPPAFIDRPQGEPGTTSAAARAPGEERQAAGRDAAELPTARNDGSTNPRPEQASSRDQELREYARHREAAGDSGGGGGEPVAMVDAAVAGDATADLAGGAAPPPPGAGAAADLNVPDEADPAGRRVRVERLPDDPAGAGLDLPPPPVAFARTEEPAVTRARVDDADVEFLHRYRAPGEDAP